MVVVREDMSWILGLRVWTTSSSSEFEYEAVTIGY